MNIRDISLAITSLETDFSLVEQAWALAETWQAHLSCCLIGLQPDLQFTDGFYATAEGYRAAVEATEEHNASFLKSARDYINSKASSVEIRETRAFGGAVADAASVLARYSDLLIARAPKHPDRLKHGELIEGALFGASSPVLVLPESWQPAAVGKRALIAWDASREASRAVHDALRVLGPGSEVCIATVDATVSPQGHGAAPGRDIAAHLARQGLKVSIQNADGLGQTVGDRLLELAAGFGADMLIMGGYRHSKLMQRVIGGTTSFLVSQSTIPVFLSH
jgi:nucleotide-binding universal stress UspA family protein